MTHRISAWPHFCISLLTSCPANRKGKQAEGGVETTAPLVLSGVVTPMNIKGRSVHYSSAKLLKVPKLYWKRPLLTSCPLSRCNNCLTHSFVIVGSSQTWHPRGVACICGWQKIYKHRTARSHYPLNY